MNKETGIYALVMQLARDRAITYDKKGSNATFPKGWFVYVGSAHGPGGLKRRVDRHRRLRVSGKRSHWNVDFFREFASIREVWYSYTQNNQIEHDWARTISEMEGASVPVSRFGATDCNGGCASHFCHFPKRPFAAGFRYELRQRYPRHPDLFVDFDDAIEIASDGANRLSNQYERGRRFLELRRHVIAGADETKWRSLARNQPARKLMETLACEMGTSFELLRQDADFAAAVDQIVSNCGNGAFKVLFSDQLSQQRGAIMRLSRTSDARQRYRVDGVSDGRFRSVGPQNADTVFDTVTFSEVTSRLRRVRGALNVLLESLNNGVGAAVRNESLRLTDFCRQSAIILKRFVEDKYTEIPVRLNKETVLPIVACRAVRGRIVGQGRLALRLTIKSVWDFHEMKSRGICPSAIDEGTIQELDRIIAIADEILLP